MDFYQKSQESTTSGGIETAETVYTVVDGEKAIDILVVTKESYCVEAPRVISIYNAAALESAKKLDSVPEIVLDHLKDARVGIAVGADTSVKGKIYLGFPDGITTDGETALAFLAVCDKHRQDIDALTKRIESTINVLLDKMSTFVVQLVVGDIYKSDINKLLDGINADIDQALTTNPPA